MLVKDMKMEDVIKKIQEDKATKPYSKEKILKVTEKSQIIEANKYFFRQDTKKNKTYEFLKNILYFILFCLVVYLGTPDNSNGARYEGEKLKGIHK